MALKLSGFFKPITGALRTISTVVGNFLSMESGTVLSTEAGDEIALDE